MRTEFIKEENAISCSPFNSSYIPTFVLNEIGMVRRMNIDTFIQSEHMAYFGSGYAKLIHSEIIGLN